MPAPECRLSLDLGLACMQYTWDKALERWVKSVGIGVDPRKAPTVQSPRDYCRRFRAAMASYFTCVPAEGDVPAPLDASAGLQD